MCAINVDCEAAQLRVPGGSSSFMCKCVCMLFYVLVCVWRVGEKKTEGEIVLNDSRSIQDNWVLQTVCVCLCESGCCVWLSESGCWVSPLIAHDEVFISLYWLIHLSTPLLYLNPSFSPPLFITPSSSCGRWSYGHQHSTPTLCSFCAFDGEIEHSGVMFSHWARPIFVSPSGNRREFGQSPNLPETCARPPWDHRETSKSACLHIRPCHLADVSAKVNWLTPKGHEHGVYTPPPQKHEGKQNIKSKLTKTPHPLGGKQVVRMVAVASGALLW